MDLWPEERRSGALPYSTPPNGRSERGSGGRGDWNRPNNIPPNNPDSEWSPDRVEILGIQTFVQRLRTGGAA